MSKLILLFLILVTRTVFTFVKPTGVSMSFPFDDMVVTLEFYVFQICEKVGYIILAYIIVNEALKYQTSLWIFFCIFVADLFDFILIYNNEWFWVGKLPVTLNNVAAIVFGISISKEFIWEKLRIS